MSRRCEIAWRLGLVGSCPSGGCRLARELGEPVLEGSRGPCVVERIAGPRPATIVLWTLEGLRRELEEARPAVPEAPLRRLEHERRDQAATAWDDGDAADYADDAHIAMDRELMRREMGYRG